MKKQNLISLLAIPIISIFSGCINNDQIRIPDHKPNEYVFEDKQIKAYENMFSNSRSGSHILEVKQKDGIKIIYIGSGPLLRKPTLDYIEEQRKGPDRRHINELSEKEKEQRKKEYKQYIEKLTEIIEK